MTSVIVPVHLRYHKPSFVPPTSQSNIVNIDKSNQQHPVAIVRMQVKMATRNCFLSCKYLVFYSLFQNPRILLSCDADNVASFCPEKSVMSYCDPTGSSKCEYLEIPYKVVIRKF